MSVTFYSSMKIDVFLRTDWDNVLPAKEKKVCLLAFFVFSLLDNKDPEHLEGQ